MADLVTKLLLDSKQFDNNLAKSTKQVQNFQTKMGNITKTASSSISSLVGVIGKIAPAIGLAVGGFEIFNRTINANEGSIDAWGKTCEAAKSSVNSFFIALNSGNFSNLLSGLDEVTRAAKEAYDAVDTLDTFTGFSDVDLARINSERAKLMFNIKDAKKNGRDTKALEDQLIATDAELVKIAQKKSQLAGNAWRKELQKVMSEAGQGENYENIEQTVTFYASGSENWEQLAVDIDKYKQKLIELRKAGYEFAYSRRGYGGDESKAKTWEDTQKTYDLLVAIQGQESAIREANKYKIQAENDIAEAYTKQSQSLKYLEKNVVEIDSKIKNSALTKIDRPIIGTSIKQLEEQLAAWKKAYENAGDDTGRAYAQKMINSINAEISTAKTPGIKDLGDKIKTDFAGWSENIAKGNKELTTTKNTVKTTTDDMATMNAMMGIMSTTMAATGENGAASFASILSAIIPVISAVGALAIAEGAEKGVKSSKNWIEAIVAVTTLVGTIAAAIAAGKNKAKYANGGIVQSFSTVGDQGTVRVNGGEMILNGSQQANLFRLLNSGNFDNSSKITGDVEFKIKGNELVGVLNNYSRKTSRVI